MSPIAAFNDNLNSAALDRDAQDVAVMEVGIADIRNEDFLIHASDATSLQRD